MTTASSVQERTNIVDVMKDFGGPNLSLPDLSETIRQVETVKTVKFAFHPWIPLSNFGSDGFRFNIPYPVLERLALIPLAVFPYPRILPKPSGQFALMGATLTEAVPSMSSQSVVKTEHQMPSVSMRELHTAYGKYGMVELVSLEAHDENELSQSFILYEAVMGVAGDEKEAEESGRRPAGLVLEDFPDWLGRDAQRALRYAEKNGVSIRDREYKLARRSDGRGEKLIAEIGHSISRADEVARNPSDGILPRTKELLNITANKGVGGKTHLDRLDEWLLKQYPSFEMDTDIARAQNAMQNAIEAGNNSGDNFKTGMMAILQQQQLGMQQQQKTLDLLAQAVLGPQKEQKEPKVRNVPTRESGPADE